jgi:hypothetical protein
MKNFFSLLISSTLLLLSMNAQAQEGATIRGNLEANGNFFLRDSVIGATNTPQYDNQLFGADVWMNLGYSYKGFDVGLRFDMFNNSNLLNPTGSYTAQGIGRWYAKKKFDKLGVSAGYLYDQIGSGIIFRAYEQRPLLIDQALYGLRLTYDITPDWQIKAFTGRQKKQFEAYESITRGAAIEGFVAIDSSSVSFAPGAGIVARTLSDETVGDIVTTLSTYDAIDVEGIKPKYNTYAYSIYNTMAIKSFTWYAEAAFKSNEIFSDPNAIRTRANGENTLGRLVSGNGMVLYSSLSFAAKGFGITLEGKRTENFDFRTSPLLNLNNGLMNFIPPMARPNTYRLTARYAAATQFLGEQAFQADISYSPSRKLQFLVNGSYIDDLNGNLLFREIFTEVILKKKRKYILTAGLQRQIYNQEVYFVKPEQPNIQTWVPYADFQYKLSKKKALRLELQYMSVNEGSDGKKVDYGDWANALLELTIAPHWTFTASDMYNVNPGKASPKDENGEGIKAHYPRFDVFYTYKTSRYSLSYVKQVEGIVCTGGICRLEPAFSGVKFSVNSTF